MNPLLDRLKERKLVQWALAYLAGAWLVLQVLDLLGDNFAWPRSIIRIATIVLAVGFLAALVLAWYHGEKGRQRVSGVELLLLAGILVMAGTAVAYVGPGEEAGPNPIAGPVPGLALPRTERSSVAVLPFANLSESKENEYFSDGITDEILTTLANVGDLRVISRTSVMRYKNTDKSLREIASELGVAHVLEGSVQRAGERVRINAQLIDAGTDRHLWAERYDRPLEDIFAVQSEIAQQIARALQAELSPAERNRLERRPTADPRAYDYVLRAWEYVRTGGPQDLETARSLLRRALELDPTYPDAYAALSTAYRHQIRYAENAGVWLDSATIAARRSISLDPEFAPGYAELGWALDLLGQRDAALEAHRHAVRLNPNLSAGLANVYHYGFGRLDEAARWWRPALEADPTESYTHWLAGRTYLHLGMPARARPLLERSIEFQPEFWWPYYNLSTAFLLEGRPEEAQAQIQRMLAAANENPAALIYAGHAAADRGALAEARGYYERGLAGLLVQDPGRGWSLDRLDLAWVLQQMGEPERARGIVQTYAERWAGSPTRPEDYVDRARLRLLQGDREGALRLIQEGVQQGWRFLYERPGDPILGSLRGEPRYDRLMAEVKGDVDRMRARVEREGW